MSESISMLKLTALIGFTIIHLAFSNGIYRDEILDGVNKGDAEKISRYFDKTVDITVKNKSQSYSKSQGSLVLKDFFYNVKVLHFEIVDLSRQPDQSEYLFGNLITKQGNFRTFILIRPRGDSKLLQEIRFE